MTYAGTVALWLGISSRRYPGGKMGILGFLLILNTLLFIAALVSIARNRTDTAGRAAVWALIVLAVPVLGSVMWFLIGRRGSQALASAAQRDNNLS